MLKFRPPTDLLRSSPPRSSPSLCMTSPILDSVSKDEKTATAYFDKDFSFSTPSSSSGSTSATDVESDSAESDTTLEEAAEIFSNFGHPLERIPRSRGVADSDFMCDSDPDFGHATIYHPGSLCSSACSSNSHSFSSVTSSTHIDYQAIVDDLLKAPGNPFDDLDPQNFVTFDPNPSPSLPPLSHEPPLMIKRVRRSSDELSHFGELNSADLREDPWNPCPHLLQIVDHDPQSEYLYLCMERLYEFNLPPMSTVAQYLDFFHQILEGLAFLHEYNLAGFSCSDPNSFMVDLSSGPRYNNASLSSLLASTATTRDPVQLDKPSKISSGYAEPHQHLHQYRHNHHHLHHHHQHRPIRAVEVQTFDRSIYPVRYYFVNFSHTRRIQKDARTRDRSVSNASPSPSSARKTSAQTCPFKRDVKELGTLIDRMLSDVPNIVSSKFKALIRAMTIGGFGAEDSRQLFEALCRPLEGEVFEMKVKSGAGLRSQSVVEISTTISSSSPANSCCGSIYVPESRNGASGEFGIELDSVGAHSS